MPPLRHQQSRTLFQACWLVAFVALALAGAPSQVWLGLLLAALFSTLLVKRAACSFVCPLFPIGELLWRSGAKLFGRTLIPPFWLDLLLRSAKYLALAWVLLALSGNGVGAGFHSVPMRSVALSAAALLVLSLVFQMPWCRYLCPAGALLGLASLASRLKVRRAPPHCVRCHKCSHRCPASLPVMNLTVVRSAECFACYRCIDGCPAPGALAFAAPGHHVVPAWRTGVLVSGVMIVGIIVGAFL